MKSISDIMDRKLVAVSSNSSLKSALQLAKVSGVDMLPILDNNKLIGIVKIDEIQNFISKNPAMEGESVQKLSKKPVFLSADESVQSGIDKIIKSGLSRMPVVENQSTMRCIGTVNSTDLLRAAAK